VTENGQKNAQKILNRRNEPKTLLKTKELAFSGSQFKLVIECKTPDQSEKCGQESTNCGALSETGNWKLETGK
jgi:hypothetical protein